MDGSDIYWSELRGVEGGRSAIARRNGAGNIEDLLPPPYSARSRVNEYGGGAFTVAAGVVYFVDNADQRIYRLQPGTVPIPVTPPDARRYADLVVDRRRGRVLAVCEDHRAGGEPAQSIIAVDINGAAAPVTLVQGRDFYAAPRLSPDGESLAFLAWDHPNMPWDATELRVATLNGAGAVQQDEHVAGGAQESVTQPSFSPAGDLYFISDRSDWWNLYRYRRRAIEPLAPQAAEFSGPPWVFGLSSYAFAAAGRVVCAYNVQGAWRLAVLDPATREMKALTLPYTDIGYVRAREERVVFQAAGPTELPAIVELDLRTQRIDVVRRSATLALGADDISIGRPLHFETGGGERAHAFFYRPQHRDARAPVEQCPPLIVMSHGGPTAATTSALNLKIQYWTSRGFAVLDVNYRGSTGYGRAYRRRLYGEWGIVDVEDCIAGARHLVAQGAVDGARLAIRGASAGGYTTLCALTFHRDFAAGASHYGISDLERLAHDTHKFESRYLERLIGPYPQERARYRRRSPIHHADRLSCPVIFFQGADDRVVPPDQTERMAQALRARGIAVAYLVFPGEQHGFRRAENVRRVLETELRFYGRVFGFTTDVDDRVADPFL